LLHRYLLRLCATPSEGYNVSAMCLAIPALILSVDGDDAEVDIGGVRRRIGIMLTPQVKVGDYVLLHTGYSIGILKPEDAEETLAAFRELAELGDIL
jgi:hydrogenase expression/formation protein HypC